MTIVVNERTLTYSSLEELSRAAAGLVEEAASAAVSRRGKFSLVLSGGSTPRRLYELLASEWKARIPWDRTHLFWADERFVPVDDAENNYGVARETFIRHVPIPMENVHPVPTGMADARAAADAYERVLRALFLGEPAFDLVLLGMGSDGHTASLFPDRSLESKRWVEAVSAPDYRPPRSRVTLTRRALNGARCILFLVSGRDKRKALERIRLGEDVPAGRIRPQEELIWMVTWDAALTN